MSERSECCTIWVLIKNMSPHLRHSFSIVASFLFFIVANFVLPLTVNAYAPQHRYSEWVPLSDGYQMCYWQDVDGNELVSRSVYPTTGYYDFHPDYGIKGGDVKRYSTSTNEWESANVFFYPIKDDQDLDFYVACDHDLLASYSGSGFSWRGKIYFYNDVVMEANLISLPTDAYTLEFYLQVMDLERVLYTTECNQDTVECGIVPKQYGLIIQSTSTSKYFDDYRLRLMLTDFYGKPLTGIDSYVKTAINDTPFSAMIRTDTFIFPTFASSTYNLTVCVEPIFDSFDSDLLIHGSDLSLCKNVIISNGFEAGSHSSLKRDGYEDIWILNGCDDLGLTDVFPALKCSFIWAFYPTSWVNDLTRLKNKFLYIQPIGYLTYSTSLILSAFTATSSDIMNVDMNLGTLVGKQSTGTTTWDFSKVKTDLIFSDTDLYFWIESVIYFFGVIAIFVFAFKNLRL